MALSSRWPLPGVVPQSSAPGHWIGRRLQTREQGMRWWKREPDTEPVIEEEHTLNTRPTHHSTRMTIERHAAPCPQRFPRSHGVGDTMKPPKHRAGKYCGVRRSHFIS